MKTESFEQRPSAATVLNLWYQIRDTLPEDKMEDLQLRFRQSGHVRCPSDDSTGAMGSRSNKRDISSILNKVNLFFKISMYHGTNLLLLSDFCFLLPLKKVLFILL